MASRWLLGALGASTLAFALVAWGYRDGGAVVRLDRRVASWVAADMPGWGEWAARVFSWLGGWIGLTVLAALLTGELLRRAARAQALLVLAVLLGAQVLTFAFKHALGRPRPTDGSAVSLPGTYSFPSGHATTAAAFFGLLTLLLAGSLPAGRARLAGAVLGVAVVLAIGASRVVLNVHYVSDVAGGFALGAAWLAACLLAAGALRRRRQSVPAAAEPARPGREGVTDP